MNGHKWSVVEEPTLRRVRLLCVISDKWLMTISEMSGVSAEGEFQHAAVEYRPR